MLYSGIWPDFIKCCNEVYDLILLIDVVLRHTDVAYDLILLTLYWCTCKDLCTVQWSAYKEKIRFSTEPWLLHEGKD